MNHGISRRFAISTGAAFSSLWSLLPVRALSETIRRRLPWAAEISDRPDKVDQRPGYLFLDGVEAAFVEAAVARLIPTDATGPGAIEANVPRFIDRQLAGPYGNGDHFYLAPPFPKGLPTQGWQAGAPSQFYRSAIPAVDAWATSTFGARFAALDRQKQDQALKILEEGKAELIGGVDGKAFFTLLLQNTIEGYFSDPIYGGNREMGPWRMIGFPGARYDLRPYVGRFGEPFDLPPVGLTGRAGSRRG